MRLRRVHHLSLIAVACFTVACGTLNYRGVQSDFNLAVEKDNQSSVSSNPLFQGPGYEDVIASLDDDTIKDLDARLQANAWMIRAFSEWRSDRLTDALTSVAAGEKTQPPPGPRDALLLKLIPSLVIDREMEMRWEKAGRKLTRAQYDADSAEKPSYFKSYRTALSKSEPLTSPSTKAPVDLLFYIRFQRWRMIQGWRQIMFSVPEDSDRAEIVEEAKSVLQKPPGAAANDERDKITADHPLRKLIDALSNR